MYKILKRELNDTVVLWNNHYIRAAKNDECIPGRMGVLIIHQQPQKEGAVSFLLTAPM